MLRTVCREGDIKLQYKASLTILLFSTALLTILVGGFSYYNEQASVKVGRESLETLAEEVSAHLDSHILDSSSLAITLSSAPLIAERLNQSNSEYAQLPETVRQERIVQLNKRWMSADNSSDPFIVKHLSNTVATFLKQQQALFPGMYGEIFLTNRFGVMVAATGKLTTLAHANKYWWKAAFNKGDGKVFFDDRGFDTSVGGYVLGAVVPIYRNGEIIGILKANINILGPIRNLIDSIKAKHEITAKLVRSNGLIVYEKGVEPLSAKVDQALNSCVSSTVSVSLSDPGSHALVACTPVPVTIETGTSGFGGKGQSVDQLKGNIDETWSILLSEDRDLALASARETAKTLIVIGLLIVLFAALLAWLLGRIAAKPIEMLSDVARAIGEGSLDTRAAVGATDEIGKLAGSVNKMAINLQVTMASRDELAHEIELRKKAEESLRLLSSSVEQAKEAISITDRAGVIEYINPAFTEVSGYSIEEVLGKKYSILRSEVESDSSFSEIGDAINSGNAWQGRVVNCTKGGLHYPSMMTISPILSEKGGITHFVAIQQSLKEHEELEARLQQSKKMEAIGTLVGGIAHDFNNKLAGMTGNLYLAKKRTAHLPDVVKNLDAVEMLSFRAAEIIKRLLIFARKDLVIMKPVPLLSLIRETVSSDEAAIAENISFIEETCEHELIVNGDTTQLQQVILNLLSNAEDAVAGIETPEIRLKVEPFAVDSNFSVAHPELKAKAFAHITVSDNGCGIKEEDRAHLFEPFFTTKGIEPGKGLGLAMVYGAAQQHEGVIEISNNSGPGVSVHIYLPLLQEYNLELLK